MKHKHLIRKAMADVHRLPRSYTSIYLMIRRHKGLRQVRCAEILQVNRGVWSRRERLRNSVRCVELVALREAFGMTWEEMGRCIEQVADCDMVVLYNTV